MAVLLLAACGGGRGKGAISDAGVQCLDKQFMQEPTAVATCTASCNARDATSCTTLGTMYERGHMVAADPAKAGEMFEKGCDLGDPVGCYNAGKQSASSGQEAKAVSFFERACAAEENQAVPGETADACFQAGTAYHDGRGVPKDDKKSEPLLMKACKLGKFDACDRFDWKPKE